jgi:hypothetical protein
MILPPSKADLMSASEPHVSRSNTRLTQPPSYSILNQLSPTPPQQMSAFNVMPSSSSTSALAASAHTGSGHRVPSDDRDSASASGSYMANAGSIQEPRYSENPSTFLHGIQKLIITVHQSTTRFTLKARRSSPKLPSPRKILLWVGSSRNGSPLLIRLSPLNAFCPSKRIFLITTVQTCTLQSSVIPCWKIRVMYQSRLAMARDPHHSILWPS